MGVVGRNRIGGEGAWVAWSWSVMKGLLPATCPGPIQARTPTCSSGGGLVPVPSKIQLKAIAPLAVASGSGFLSHSTKHNYRIKSIAVSGAQAGSKVPWSFVKRQLVRESRPKNSFHRARSENSDHIHALA